jgi:phosphate transport system permease protein
MICKTLVHTKPQSNHFSRLLLFSAAGISMCLVLAVFAFLMAFAWPVFAGQEWKALLSMDWRPFQGHYGILPMIQGSLALTATAMLVAYPLGIGLCLFCSGIGPDWAARFLRGLIQFMAGIPTVVYGFVAAFTLVPFLRHHFSVGTGYSWLAASIVLSFLVLPTVVLIGLSAVHRVQQDLSLTCSALGLSKVQSLVSVIFPAAWPGLLAAGLLGFGRAVGDTLIALMLAGNAPQTPNSMLDSIRVLTAHIALVVATDSQSPAYRSVFVAGCLLFAIAAVINVSVFWVQKKYSRTYAPE